MLAPLVMIFAAFGWAFGNIGAKAALAELQPQTFLAVRFAAALACLVLVLVLSGRLHRLAGARRGQVLLGICEPFIQNGLTAIGLGFVPGNHAVVLWALMPVVAPLLGRMILKEPLSRAVSAGAVLAISGALVLVLGGEFTSGSLLGDGLIVTSILLACFTQILSRHMASGGSDPVVTSTIQMTTSTVLALLTWAVMLPFTDAAAGPQPTATTWVLAAAVGLFGSALPFICYHYAMRTMSVGRTALFVPLVAPLGTALSGLWLGEALGVNVYAALVLTLAGVMLPTVVAQWRREEKPAPGPRPEVFDPSAYLAPSPELSRLALDAVDYVVFDCETTGLRPSNGDRIVQIGAVRVRGGTVVPGERFDTLVNPGRRIPAQSTGIHGITDAMVAHAPSTAEALRAFRAYVGDAVLVAHNAAFDLKFLHLSEGEAGVRFDRPAIDTLLIAARLDPTEPADLDSALRRHGLAVTRRHGALPDAEATAELLVRQLAELGNRQIGTLGELVRVTRMVAELRARSHRF